MGFSRHDYWSGLPCPSPGDLPDPGTEPTSLVLQVDSLPLSHPGNAFNAVVLNKLNVKGKSVMNEYQQFTENQQGPAGQHRERCSILCNHLMVTRGKDGEGIVREFGDMDTLLCLTWRTSKDLLDSTGNSAQYSVTTLWSPAGRMGEGIVRESGMDMDTLLCLTWRTSKDLLDSTGHSAQYHVAAWMGGEFGADWIHVYVWLSPVAVHLKPSRHC